MMQDIIIFICNIFMAYALIPQIYYNFKNKKSSVNMQTSLLTTICLFVVAIVFITLGLWFSFFITLVIGGLWFVLFVQRIKYSG